ncbi:MAG: antirepressor protein [Prokaryotic dsDNA virus sp.]|nr:MAG: antirepressor protein [Prokaryotic dsDNA virus sp.]|tara:strand:+ start:6138 stop:6605 length:468 start_codon:yes stop_codon:yes gene_type:complete
MDLVTYKNDHAVTNSKVIADAFGKVHRNVMRDIESLDCSDEFRALNFEQSYYISPQNKKLKCYEITRDGFSFLCMGFTGSKAAEWKEKYINAFNQMEKGLLNIDSRMSKLAIDGENIKKLGSDWSEFGRQIKAEKKRHKLEVESLISDVQGKLEL